MLILISTGIGFDARGTFSFPNGGFGQNVVISDKM